LLPPTIERFATRMGRGNTALPLLGRRATAD
jgi:hypothetical protein